MRKMLHLMTKTPSTAGRGLLRNFGRISKTTGLVLGLMLVGVAHAQNPAPGTAPMAAPGTAPISPTTVQALNAYTGPTYNNRYELFGGLNYSNGQAGQNLQSKYNMGGGEIMAAYWLGSAPVGRLSVLADVRFDAGTTPTAPGPGNNQTIHLNRVFVYQEIFAGGVQYRGFKNRYFAIDYHALAGASNGVYDHATLNYPGGSPVSACPAQQASGQIGNLGLYCDGIAPWAAAGGSIDFNESQRFAVRLSPEITFEHFGTETREYFSISGGLLYRFGKR